MLLSRLPALSAEPLGEPAPVTPSALPATTTVHVAQPSRVAIVRSTDPSCGEFCPAWISIEGHLTAETETAFRAILKKLGNSRLPVLVHSGGGLVTVGYAIGRMIRERHLDVGVAKTVFAQTAANGGNCTDHCTAETATKEDASRLSHEDEILAGQPHSLDAFCASACTFILAAGEHRYVAPWSHIGVHQILDIEKHVTHYKKIQVSRSVSPETHEIIEKRTILSKHDKTWTVTHDEPTAATLSKLQLYLKEMGIGPRLQTLMAETEYKNIHWMTHAELQQTGLVTDYFGGDMLTAISTHPLAAQTFGPQPQFPFMRIRSPVGPQAPMDAVASIVFQPSWTKSQKAKAMLELTHRRFSGVVVLSVTLDNHDALNPRGTFAAAIAFGGAKDAASVLVRSPAGTYPMNAQISIGQFCNLRSDKYLKVKLAQLAPEQIVSPFGVYLPLDRIGGIQQLIDEVCPVKPNIGQALGPISFGQTAETPVPLLYRHRYQTAPQTYVWQGLTFYPIRPSAQAN